VLAEDERWPHSRETRRAPLCYGAKTIWAGARKRVGVARQDDRMPTSRDEPSPRLVPLAGSHRPVAGERVAELPPTTRVEFTVVLRRRAELPDDVVSAGRLTPAELAARYGAAAEDIQLVTRTLTAHDVEVLDIDAASRRIRGAASARTVERTFGTQLYLAHTTSASGHVTEHRAREGQLSIPAALDGVVVAVVGLDTRPQARSQARAVPAAQVSTSYAPPQLATVYRMPANTDGAGQTVAIIELGGGFSQADLDTYFRGLGLATPTVTAVGVDGATNLPGQDPSGADGEVLLDIEVVGGIAPKAAILVYFAPNTDAGFLDAISDAAHATPTPTAITISWGQNEDDWTAQSRAAMDGTFADAAALGITVTAAAGDSGSSDGAPDGSAHTDFPAASPHLLGCGGTSLHANPTTGRVRSETVWNNSPAGGSTGGGVSDTFSLPTWQRTAGVPQRPSGGRGRGVPDVAAVADPRTGYQVYVDGEALVIGGTSAVAPLWAALSARLSQALGRRLGLLNPQLYAGIAAGEPTAGFRDITSGDNGAYSAAPGWDACTGLGVPDGATLLERLRSG
jgi:kumamolisin